MDELAAALEEAGGIRAPRERAARLRALLDQELERGERELQAPRSGYEAPVTVAIAATDEGRLLGLVPAPAVLRADPDAVNERTWLLTAALLGALVESSTAPADAVLAGDRQGRLVLAMPGDDPELAALAFDDQARGIDRLRARALAMPSAVLDAIDGFKEPIGAAHPLRVAAAVARLGGHPADPQSVAAHEEAVLAALQRQEPQVSAPHDDPDPPRRVARRILQRLNGMGKWGGYHTEFAHLSRGFAGNERALAERVGESLLAAGLLAEKPSVGQRHVFLNPRRARDIYALIEEGALPGDIHLPPG
jgi:hypothetical protein